VSPFITDSGGFVPYTGATAPVDLGAYGLTAGVVSGRGIKVEDSSGTSNSLNLKTATLGTSLSGAGYVSLTSNTADYLSIYYGNFPKVADLDGSALTARRTFTFPDASGVLPLSVNGETPDAAGNITINAVTKVGTPVNNQLAVWTGDGTVEGDSFLKIDSLFENSFRRFQIGEENSNAGFIELYGHADAGANSGIRFYTNENANTEVVDYEIVAHPTNGDLIIQGGSGTGGGVYLTCDATTGVVRNSATVAEIDSIGATAIPTVEWVQAQDSRPYKVYTALISQVGTAAPTVEHLLENTIGTIGFTYELDGLYRITSSSLFDSTKTTVMCGNLGLYHSASLVANSSQINLSTSINGVYTNGGMVRNMLEIRIYN